MRALALSVAAMGILVGVYLALGGASYAPAKVADPCVPREWRIHVGPEKVAEQIVLSALDGAACKLGVSREDIVLAFASSDSLKRFARVHRISQQRLEELVRAGLLHSIDDAEQAGALDSTLANLFRGFVRRLPIGGLLDVLGQLLGF